MHVVHGLGLLEFIRFIRRMGGDCRVWGVEGLGCPQASESLKKVPDALFETRVYTTVFGACI